MSEKRAPAGPNLNHYDELIEVVREVAGAPMPYPAHARATRRRAIALLARLPNQQKAAIPSASAILGDPRDGRGGEG